jgi:thiol-disulfide isomerase/thioredoxin
MAADPYAGDSELSPTPTAAGLSSRSSWLWWAAALLLLAAGGWWVWASRMPEESLSALRTPAPAVGHPAPGFNSTLLSGEPISLAGLQGTPVVLNFWATWCGPCRAEMPALERAAQRYDGRAVILGVNQAEDPAVIQEFVEEYGITFPIVLDGDQAIGYDAYAVSGLPTTYFIDGDGVIRRLWMGEMNSITLEEGIAEILQSPTP